MRTWSPASCVILSMPLLKHESPMPCATTIGSGVLVDASAACARRRATPDDAATSTDLAIATSGDLTISSTSASASLGRERNEGQESGGEHPDNKRTKEEDVVPAREVDH